MIQRKDSTEENVLLFCNYVLYRNMLYAEFNHKSPDSKHFSYPSYKSKLLRFDYYNTIMMFEEIEIDINFMLLISEVLSVMPFTKLLYRIFMNTQNIYNAIQPKTSLCYLFILYQRYNALSYTSV